ncbi:MAG TPA: hypothetical protein VMU90_04165 [Solirubrobacteraceae bacterium]|nr:hypothetical protein [Solirubrobacteraceae bacterium]
MCALANWRIIFAMTYPARTSRVVLLEDTRAMASPGPLRRYRLARLQLDGRSADPEKRFAHLKRIYD